MKYANRNDIVAALDTSRTLVLVGAAGCGKSTRAPAFILDAYLSGAKILVSEPRRVAAIGLASRVAAELGEDVGETVGFQVRLHAKPPRPPGGSILYCTSGVLLRRLQLNPGLEGCSHVFIDEAHERDVNTDITLLLLKRALQLNPELKVIIMSATLDTTVFTGYFQNCAVLEVPGRTYPVTVTHLEDLPDVFENINVSEMLENCRQEGSKPQINYQEVVEVIKAVDTNQPEGAILVFLPGWSEIKNVKNLLDVEFGDRNTHVILPVHSRLSTTDQAKMFSRPLPGVRKIVLSTNIAETSITIPDAVYVIDTGAHKENRIIERTGVASLETVWVSQAAAKQRTGRAGRLQPGHCYRLYTKDKEKEFIPYTTAEILRIPLEQIVLDCKSYAPDDKVEDFLSQLPEPPSEKAIVFAVNDLVDLGALSMPEQKLTVLGRLLSSFTLPPRLGCALLYSAAIGNVVSMSNIVSQLSSNVEVFENSAERREEIRDIKRKYSEISDHIALNRLQEEYEDIKQNEGWKAIDKLCMKYGIRKERLKFISDLSRLHLEQLLKSGVVESDPNVEELNRFSSINELNKATLLAACNSLLITRRTLKTKGKMAIVKSVFTSIKVLRESMQAAVTPFVVFGLFCKSVLCSGARRRCQGNTG
ncbi:Putative ATP-dependent RNA helicase DHX30 [Eumeta japonica]|uniref:ATP-dependent RNA helicase DHX30 n=1 Tax=Eumeta variegata TaxID=151549 RepID=A0A4C1VQK3_EUMVA|nr:Putative ATP-dependent RNA helicase DHX30 [Eumeta japonica]